MSKDDVKALRACMLVLFGMGIVLSVVYWGALLSPLLGGMLGLGGLMYVMLEPTP